MLEYLVVELGFAAIYGSRCVPVTLRQGPQGRPEMVATIVGEAEETYIFTLLEASTTATPVP